MDRYEKARAHKQSLERDIGLRNERLAQLKEEATQLEPVKQSDIDAFISLNQQENEIKNKEFELTAIEKDIANKQRDKDELQANIGWSETHHDVDSSEAMKSYVSEQIKNKQEQAAYIKQLERSLEENKIEDNAVHSELDSVREIVPEETFEKKKEYSQQVIELNEKENLYSKLKERFEIEQQEKQKRQKLLRTTFILLTLVGIGLTAFSFYFKQHVVWYYFRSINFSICYRYHHVSKSKEVDYSEAITDEIEEIKAQLAILDENYDLDFDLDEQYRIRDHGTSFEK